MTDYNNDSNATLFEAPNGSQSVTTLPNMESTLTMPVATTGNSTTASESHGHNMEMSDKKGMIFDEQTELANIRYPPSTKATAVSEPAWDMKSFFAIPVRIASGTWSTTQTNNTILRFWRNPTVAFAYDRWARVFQRYTYYRYRVVYRVELNGTPFHAGKLVLFTAPYNTAGNINSMSQTAATPLPHVTLYPAYNNVVELETQWLSTAEYQSVDTTTVAANDLQDLNFSVTSLIVANQLTTGTGGSTALNYTVYAYLKDVELYIPVALTGSAQGLFSYTAITNNIQSIENSSMPQNVSGDEYDVAASLAGMDLPADPTAPSSMVRRTTSSNHQVRGFPSFTRVSLYPESQVVCSKYNFEVPFDEMSMDYLMSRWNFNSTTTLTTSQTFGTVIFSTPLSPYIPPVSTSTQTLGPTTYLCSLFSHWSGDIDFCVEVVGTQYHTAKLFCGVSYSATPPASFSTTGEDPTTYYGKVIEVNKAKSCFEITAPFQYPLKWLRTIPYGYTTGTFADALVVPNGAAGPFPYTYPNASFGTFFIAILNPLVIPSNVATSIALNVFQRPGKNFLFHTPRGSMHSFCVGAQPQSDDAVGNRPVPLSASEKSTLPERVRSLRDLLKRFQYAASFPLTTVPFTVAPKAPHGCASSVDLEALFSLGSFVQYTSVYRAYCGDLRVKVVADWVGVQNYGPMHVIYVPPDYYRGNASIANSPILAYLGSILLSYIAKTSQPGPGGSALEYPGRGINGLTTLDTAGATFFGYPNVASGTGEAPARAQMAITSEILVPSAPSIELEIPYYAASRYTRTNSVNSNNVFATRSENPYGYLVFWCPSNSTPVAASATNICPTVTLYVAGGDTMRFAQYSIPQVIVPTQVTRLGGTNFFPGSAAVLATGSST